MYTNGQLNGPIFVNHMSNSNLLRAGNNIISGILLLFLGKCKAYIVRLLHQSVAKIRLKQTV